MSGVGAEHVFVDVARQVPARKLNENSRAGSITSTITVNFNAVHFTTLHSLSFL